MVKISMKDCTKQLYRGEIDALGVVEVGNIDHWELVKKIVTFLEK